MGVFSKLRRRRGDPYAATTDEERAARYVYLLGTLPASVIESAHATAFADVPEAKRRDMFEQLRPFLAESERDSASAEPVVLARLVRRAEEWRAQKDHSEQERQRTQTRVLDPLDAADPRQVMVTLGIMGMVSHQFLLSASLTAYFTVGAGSLTLGGEPEWVAATYDPVGFASDGAGGMPGGFDGGGVGFDGGGGFGGFDGGGFGGDGGGGF